LSVLPAFVSRNDLVFSDAQNHASIIDGIRLSRAKRVKFHHCNVDHLHRLLAKAPAGPQKFLVTESLFSMDGDIAPLAEYAELCRQTSTTLIVDEAHAVGIYGERGSGLIEEAGIDDAVFVSVNTAGKALGVAGAFVAGPQWAIDYLIQTARPFIFSTAPPPGVAAALAASLTLVENEPERRLRVLHNSAFLRRILNAPGRSQIISYLIGDNERACTVAAELQKEGFDIRAIRPPTVPPGTARLRISVNANLDETTLGRFAKALEACCAVCS
jgi:8-amino-7-oxononanoate synthase